MEARTRHPEDREPILEKLTNIEHGDAILRYDEEGNLMSPSGQRRISLLGIRRFWAASGCGGSWGISVSMIYCSLRRTGAHEVDLVTYWFSKSLLRCGRTVPG